MDEILTSEQMTSVLDIYQYFTITSTGDDNYISEHETDSESESDDE